MTVHFWVLVNIPMVQTHRAVQRVLGCADMGVKALPWIIGDNVFGERRASCKPKTSVVDFEQE
jgi:hypothetical protein